MVSEGVDVDYGHPPIIPNSLEMKITLSSATFSSDQCLNLLLYYQVFFTFFVETHFPYFRQSICHKSLNTKVAVCVSRVSIVKDILCSYLKLNTTYITLKLSVTWTFRQISISHFPIPLPKMYLKDLYGFLFYKLT